MNFWKLPWRRESEGGSENIVRPRLRWAHLFLVLPALALIVVHVIIFPPSRSVRRIQVEVGSITDQDLRAPFTFTAPRPVRELESARHEATQRVEPVYRPVEGVERRNQQRSEVFFRDLVDTASDSSSTAQKLVALARRYPGLPDGVAAALLAVEDFQETQAATAAVVDEMMSAGTVDISPRGSYQQVRILDPGGATESTRPATTIVLDYRRKEFARAALNKIKHSAETTDLIVDLAIYLAQPNLSYDDVRTETRRRAASEAVSAVREYARNERILEAGVRVTRDHVQVLQALELARMERALAQDSTIGVRLRLGRVLMVALLLSTLAYLVHQYDRRMLFQRRRWLLVLSLLTMFLGLSALVLRQPAWGGPMAVPIVLLATLSTVLFGANAGARISGVGILLLSIAGDFNAPVVVIWAVAAAASVRMVRKVRNRNQFYKALGVVTAAYVVSIFSLQVGSPEGLGSMFDAGARAVGSGVASIALCLFLLPLCEAMFGITTDLTLLELSDLNHPLLKRMSLESPGTYHHSQVVGSLGEAGARAVGANSLMARVGANFHDIGKMLKPRYYVENQSGENKHDDLSPSMSALVIAAHVKDGMELGRRWGLPEEVVAYIPEHHGTSVMQYFYHKALESDDGGTVNVDDFRYPGPKPQTRESAIVMLADGVEASTRSLRRPTASRIREMVRKIFDRKMAEGQLDESGLSLSELATAREAFIPILLGIHHHRVAYPGQREHEEKKEKESVEARSGGRRGSSSVASPS